MYPRSSGASSRSEHWTGDCRAGFYVGFRWLLFWALSAHIASGFAGLVAVLRFSGGRWGTNGHLWSLPSSRGTFSGSRLAFPGRQTLHSVIRGAACGGAGVGLAVDNGGPEVLAQLDARTSLTRRPVLPGPRLAPLLALTSTSTCCPRAPSSSADPFPGGGRHSRQRTAYSDHWARLVLARMGCVLLWHAAGGVWGDAPSPYARGGRSADLRRGQAHHHGRRLSGCGGLRPPPSPTSPLCPIGPTQACSPPRGHQVHSGGPGQHCRGPGCGGGG